MLTDQNHQTIIFLSPGNSVRSIFAEHLMNVNIIGRNRFTAYSAGSQPTGVVHPYAIRVLRDHYKIDTREVRSKSWDEFRDAQFNMVITVCDRAMESCPRFLGQPRLANWNIPPPGEVYGSDEQTLINFREVAQ
jgi:arsenate reductase (thioredoxin)